MASAPVIQPEDYFLNETKRVAYLDDCCTYITYKSKIEFNYLSNPKLPPFYQQNYPTTVTLYKENCCGGRDLVEQDSNVLGNDTKIFSNLSGDGTYIVEIHLYSEIDGYDFKTEIKLCAKCCENKRDSLVETVKEKLANISCRILDFKVVGRNTKKLETNYHKLSNILYVLNYSNCYGRINLTCGEVEKIKCLIVKIK